MGIQTANRISNVKEYYFSKKLREIAEMKKSGIEVINLGIGSPDLPPANSVIAKLRDTSQYDNHHGYQPYVGIPQLREAFAGWYKRFYDVTLNPDNEILPLMGSKEGIMHISMAYLNPEDEVLVPNPGYPTYMSVSELVGSQIRTYDLNPGNNWYPDFDALENTDLSKVKIMWVNYPNMPTGTPATMKLFERLIRFGKEHNILICNDNPYSFILNENPLSILKIDGAKDIAIELNSLSKSHNMAGWRIGMAAASTEIISHVLRVKSNMDSGMFLPLQMAAVEALNSPGEWYRKQNEIYAQRRNIVFEIFDFLGCTYQIDQTGMFVWAKIPDLYQNAAEISDKLLYEANVFVTPGFIFGTNGQKYLRISLCNTIETFKASFQKIKEVMPEPAFAE